MVRINLLPVRVSKKKEAGKQQLLLFLVLLLGGLVGNWVWASTRADALATEEAKVRKTREEIARLDRIIGEVKNVKAEQQALREKLDVLERLRAARTGPVRMLDQLATLTPKRLWLRKIEEKNGVMVFAGTAASIDDVSAFMEALKRSTFFSDVELKKTASRTEKAFRLVDFDLTTGVRYVPPPAPGAAAPGTSAPGTSPGPSAPGTSATGTSTPGASPAPAPR